MRLIRDFQNLIHESTRYVVTIGNFDGLHSGHQTMLNTLKEVAKNENLPTCVVVFEPLPQEHFSHHPLPRLMQLTEKLTYFKSLGIDLVVCLRFNSSLANLSANAFIEQCLLSALKLKALIVGDDFRFGHLRQGNVNTLQLASKKNHFEIYQIGTIYKNYKRVSSTQIRHALKEGDLGLATCLLGRNYSFTQRVIHGQKQGRILGFPTANFSIKASFPLSGVFLTRVKGLSQPYFAVTNVGSRPTLDGKKYYVEAHLLHFEGDLYGQRLTLEFLYRIRDETKFPNIETLKKQIYKDKKLAENLTTSILGD